MLRIEVGMDDPNGDGSATLTLEVTDTGSACPRRNSGIFWVLFLCKVGRRHQWERARHGHLPRSAHALQDDTQVRSTLGRGSLFRFSTFAEGRAALKAA